MSATEWQIVWFTAWVSALSTIMILPFGLGMAWLLARRDWPGKSFVETFISLPLVMPPVATGLILLKLFGRRGAVGGFLHQHFDFDVVFTWRGELIALSVMSFPCSGGTTANGSPFTTAPAEFTCNFVTPGDPRRSFS